MTSNNEITISSKASIESKQSSLVPRIIAGSVGSIITALAVTPLEVVKVRQQAAIGSPILATSASSTTAATVAASIKKCPDCGVFILNNGLMECIVSKTSVPYFQSMISGYNSKMAKEDSYGTFRLLRSIFRREGLNGIYAGLSPTLVMSVPNTVLYFTAYDELSFRLRQFSKKQQERLHKIGTTTRTSTDSHYSFQLFDNVLTPLLCGSTARLIASVVTSPLELIRTRQASSVSSSSSTTIQKFNPPPLLKELQTIIRTEGFLSLYKGLTPTLYRDVPFSAIYWLCLEQFKSLLRNNYIARNHDHHLEGVAFSEPIISPLVASSHAFISGALAGMIAAFCTTPFDVVKTRQQTVILQQMGNKEQLELEHTKKNCFRHRHTPIIHRGLSMQACPSKESASFGSGNIWVQLREIASTEGMAGLWRGNQTRMIKIAPACAIMISCYEFGKLILDSD